MHKYAFLIMLVILKICNSRVRRVKAQMGVSAREVLTRLQNVRGEFFQSICFYVNIMLI